jgi:hypothetical protein
MTRLDYKVIKSYGFWHYLELVGIKSGNNKQRVDGRKANKPRIAIVIVRMDSNAIG